MQFYCYECHKPHSTVRPDYGTCISCHELIMNVGRHKSHAQTMGLECTSCHIQHSWRVTKEAAKDTCTQWHEYKDPIEFIGPGV